MGESRRPRRRDRRGPREISEAVARLRAEVEPPTLLAAVQERWFEAAGASVAEEAIPISERDGVVTVACRSAVWASELTMLAGSLLGRLNEVLEPDRQVAALRFLVRPT
jgi:predicted nucleic acid-binding Zn ribbon protein